MMIFGLLFLMPSAIFAYGNNGNYQHSMDYNNDPRNRDSEIKPGSNIIFNFEQLRRDQPPQIEMRDENLGQYRNRHTRPPTTTTMAPIYVPKIQENRAPSSRYSNMPAPVPTDHYRQSSPMHPQYNSNPSTPMPSPPPAPKWSDFSETFNKLPFPHYESRKTFETPVVPEFNNAQRLQSTRAQHNLFDQKMPSLPEFNNHQWPQEQSNAPVKNRNQVNHDYRWNSMPPARSLSSSTPDHHTHDRGNHKFGWTDLVTEPSWTNYEPQNTPAPNVQGQHPPPLATLTPWLDGFGK